MTAPTRILEIVERGAPRRGQRPADASAETKRPMSIADLLTRLPRGLTLIKMLG
jgi:hypothetical protein